MIKALVVDDVSGLRESIIFFLQKYCPTIEVVSEADSVESAKRQIPLVQPDLVFLDIELGDGTAFELLKSLKEINFKIIFVTAYSHYAINALKYSTIDYLLKPIIKEELIEAVDKAEKALEKELFFVKLQTLFENVSNPFKAPKKIVLKTMEKIYSIRLEDIIRCESFKNYTTFYLTEEKKVTVSTTLKEYDELLSENGFFRSHQSHIINFDHIDHFVKRDGGTVVMSDQSEVPVSSRKKELLLAKISS